MDAVVIITNEVMDLIWKSNDCGVLCKLDIK